MKKNGLPIRNLIRQLGTSNQLHLIPYLFADRKMVYTKWYFIRGNTALNKIVKLKDTFLNKKTKKK